MSNRLRLCLVILIDLLLINAALWLAFMIRWNWEWNAHALYAYKRFAPMVTLTRLFVFYANGLYPWSFKHAGFGEGMRIVRAVLTGSMIIIALIFITNFRRYVGRTIPIVEFLLCSFFIVGFRFAFRVQTQVDWRKGSKRTRVLIVGAGATGAMVARELLNSQTKTHKAVGFIDDDGHKSGQRIHNIKVLGGRQDMSQIVLRHRVDEIIIALPNASGKVIRELILSCQNGGVRFKFVPGLQKILSGKVEMKSVRDVKPGDLLGRKSIHIDDKDIESYIQDKVVFVSGAGGSIGSELVRQIARYRPKELLLCDHYENEVYFLEMEIKDAYPALKLRTVIGDISDVALLKHTFYKHRPDVVFHAAAHKHVPLMEDNPAAAVKNNIIATRNLVYASEHYGVSRFVLISSDKAVNPTNVMGATKRITEMLCQAKSKNSRTKFMAVRFGNVLGSSGSVVHIFKKQIENGGPLTITHPEIRRYFMTVSEAAQLVLQAGGLGNGGEIFILDMGEQLKIVDLAKNLITLSGLEEGRDIEIEFSGLRPGEKLYEEMLHDAEHDQSTRHDQIFIAQPDEFDIKRLRRDIETLKNLANQMDHDQILEKIRQIVPSFKPQFESKSDPAAS